MSSHLESEFDASLAKKIVDEFSFPRYLGSDGSKQVIDLLETRFKEIGVQIKREPFLATKFWTTTLTQLAMLLALTLCILMDLLTFIAPEWNILIIASILILAFWGFAKSSGSGGFALKGTPIETANIVFSIPAKNQAKGKIIFMGHHDSKSQTLTTVMRSAGFTLGGIALLIVTFVFTIHSLMVIFSLPINPTFLMIGHIAAICVVIFAGALALNFSQNKSPGALDNASSIAAQYLLAKYFKMNPLDNYELIFLSTGAEEVGMLGAQAYIKNHEAELNPESTYVINFDMIGRKGEKVEVLEKAGFPKPRPTCEYLHNLAREIANEYHFDFQGFSLPVGAATDAFIFRKHKICSADFINRKAAFETHSPRDKPENFDPELAKRFIIIGAEMAKRLDKK